MDGGRIEIGDRDVSYVPPKDRDIAMVFQNYALYPQKTVAENMGFALKMAGVPKDQRARRVAEAARLLDLDEGLLDRKPRALSGGQRQRVAMGRAIVREPQVFLMDEPLSNLDAKLRVQTRSQIAELQRRLGITTVYVTHDQVEAMTMGNRVAVLSGGHLQQCDTPRQLYDNPVNQFVAGFIGSPAMNLITVPLTEGGARLAGTVLPLPTAVRTAASQADLTRSCWASGPSTCTWRTAPARWPARSSWSRSSAPTRCCTYGWPAARTRWWRGPRAASPRPQARRSGSTSSRTTCSRSTRRPAPAWPEPGE